MNEYSFKKGLTKTLTAVALFGIPILFEVLPEAWLNLTLGGVLALALNWVKVKYL
jgi:hypothetical protein